MKFVFMLLLQLTCSMESTCTYCLDTLKNGEKTRTTLCKHQFHKKCINEWVDGNRTQTCPICRQHVNSHRELIEAAKGGDRKIQKCTDLLIEGVDIDAKDDFGFNALHHAVYLQHYKTVNFLLANGAEVDALDKNDDTPLIQAAQFRKFPVTEAILKLLLQAKANVNHVDKDKWSALMTAASYGNVNIVKILLQQGADASLKNRDGRTARELSAGQNVQRVFEEFEREKHANIEAQKQKSREKNISFLEAAKVDDVNKVHDLIQKGADVDSVEFDGTALHIAAMNGYGKLVVELLKQNAEVNCRTQIMNYTPLMLAAESFKPNLNIVKILLEKGADKRLKNNKGMTAFDMAKDFTIKQELVGSIEDGFQMVQAEKKQLATQKKAEEKRLKDQLPVLAERRLNELFLRKNKNRRPQSTINKMFVAAAEAGDVSEVELLLFDGAHINCIDVRGFTALHHATMAGNAALVKVLLKYNPNLNCKAPFIPLNAPLHFTALYGYPMIMKMLLDAGVNPNLKNSDGKTALDLANDDNCKRLLENEIGYHIRCLDAAAACGYKIQNMNSEVLQKIMK